MTTEVLLNKHAYFNLLTFICEWAFICEWGLTFIREWCHLLLFVNRVTLAA